jgi:predicted glycosyltransferase involved in capsule biosynthesis
MHDSGFRQMLRIITVAISNYAFIYGFFNDALKSSDYMASNDDN